ncbi:MAG: hypothetical protein M8354_03620 [Halalkalicoccus sp.]|nr:hypothetical protein [Halalkalicoccus sp.]
MNENDHDHEHAPEQDPPASGPSRWVVSFETADDRTVIYDAHRPTTWIRSTGAVALKDAC